MRKLLEEQLNTNINQSTPVLFIFYSFLYALFVCALFIYDNFISALTMDYWLFFIGISLFFIYGYILFKTTIKNSPLIFLSFVTITLLTIVHSTHIVGLILIYLCTLIFSSMYADTKIQLFFTLIIYALACFSLVIESTVPIHLINSNLMLSLITIYIFVGLLTYIVSWRIQALFRMQVFNDIKNISQFNTDLVSSLLLTIDAKDSYTGGHSERVSDYATTIAKLLPEFQLYSKLEIFKYTVLLHDIGKLQMPDYILLKDGKLTDEEYAIIKKHSAYGAEIIRKIRLLEQMYSIILCHHERWDGKGYPLGLKADNIPLEARIIAIADSFDAMTSNRPYRNALSTDEAFKRLEEGKGTQYDPELIELLPLYKNAFLQIYNQTELKEETA